MINQGTLNQQVTDINKRNITVKSSNRSNYKTTSICKSIFIGILLVGTPLGVYAETKYVIDHHYFPVRSGKGNQFRIVKSLKSGAAVVIIKKDKNSDWVKVETSSGVEGWIEDRYLSNVPSAKDRLAKLQNMLNRMKQSGSSQQARLIEMEQKIESLEAEKQTLTRSNKTLDKELNKIKELSKNAIRLDRTNNELIQKNQQMIVDLEQMTAERDKLKYDNKNTGLKLGALILIAGIILGMVAPMLKPSKKDTGWA